MTSVDDIRRRLDEMVAVMENQNEDLDRAGTGRRRYRSDDEDATGREMLGEDIGPPRGNSTMIGPSREAEILAKERRIRELEERLRVVNERIRRYREQSSEGVEQITSIVGSGLYSSTGNKADDRLISPEEYSERYKKEATAKYAVGDPRLDRSEILQDYVGREYQPDCGPKDSLFTALAGAKAALEKVTQLSRNAGEPMDDKTREFMGEYMSKEGIMEAEEMFERGMDRRDDDILARTIGLIGNPNQSLVPPPELGNVSMTKHHRQMWDFSVGAGNNFKGGVRAFKKFLWKAKAFIERNRLDEMSAYHLLGITFKDNKALRLMLRNYDNIGRGFSEVWRVSQTMDLTMDETSRAKKALQILLSKPPEDMNLWLAAVQDLCQVIHSSEEDVIRRIIETGKEMKEAILTMSERFAIGMTTILQEKDQHHKEIIKKTIKQYLRNGWPLTSIELHMWPGFALAHYIRSFHQQRGVHAENLFATKRPQMVRMNVSAIEAKKPYAHEDTDTSEGEYEGDLELTYEEQRGYEDTKDSARSKKKQSRKKQTFERSQRDARHRQDRSLGQNWQNPKRKGVSAIETPAQPRSYNNNNNRFPPAKQVALQPRGPPQQQPAQQQRGDQGKPYQRVLPDGSVIKRPCWLCNMNNHWRADCRIYPNEFPGPQVCDRCGGRHVSQCKARGANVRSGTGGNAEPLGARPKPNQQQANNIAGGQGGNRN